MKTRSNKAWLRRLRDRREAREQKERDRIEFERRRKDRKAWEATTPGERDLAGRRHRRVGSYGLMAMSIMLGGRHL